jgi:hypothetical protein
MKMHLESFLWHPYSIAYNHRHEHFKLNDVTILGGTLNSIYIVTPPRSGGSIPAHVDVLSVVKRWAASMQLVLRVENHIVICEVCILHYALACARIFT